MNLEQFLAECEHDDMWTLSRQRKLLAIIRVFAEALEKYADETLYRCCDDGILVKPGKIGWDDPPEYDEIHNHAREAQSKVEEIVNGT